MVEIYLVGRYQLGIKIVYVAGNPSDPTNKGCRIWYSVFAHGEIPPVKPDELRESFFDPAEKGFGAVRLRGQREDGVLCKENFGLAPQVR